MTWDLGSDSVKWLSSHHVSVVYIMSMSWVTEEAMRQKSSTWSRIVMRVRVWGEGKEVSGKSRWIVVRVPKEEGTGGHPQ